RRVRHLERLRHHADGAHDAIDHPGAVAPRRLQVPRRRAGRDAPVPALVAEQVLGPGPLDDAEALLERGPVGGVDLVVLVGEGAVDAVRLLCHHVHPAPLVAAGEARVGAAARHVVEHRDLLGDTDRVVRREDDAELADADALRLQADEEVEPHGAVRELEALHGAVALVAANAFAIDASTSFGCSTSARYAARQQRRRPTSSLRAMRASFSRTRWARGVGRSRTWCACAKSRAASYAERAMPIAIAAMAGRVALKLRIAPLKPA